MGNDEEHLHEAGLRYQRLFPLLLLYSKALLCDEGAYVQEGSLSHHKRDQALRIKVLYHCAYPQSLHPWNRRYEGLVGSECMSHRLGIVGLGNLISLVRVVVDCIPHRADSAVYLGHVLEEMPCGARSIQVSQWPRLHGGVCCQQSRGQLGEQRCGGAVTRSAGHPFDHRLLRGDALHDVEYDPV